MVKFVGSFKEDFPTDDKKHFVFVGRSNVGKSSLINMLTNSNIAKVSKEPGRTRAVNFILFNDRYLVDLPGYGFAKVSKEERERWKVMVERYFEQCRENIALVFFLVDSLVGPTELDKEGILWLEDIKLPYLIVLTKTDKASQKEISQTIKKLKEITDAHVVFTSAKEGKGKKELLSYILA